MVKAFSGAIGYGLPLELKLASSRGLCRVIDRMPTLDEWDWWVLSTRVVLHVGSYMFWVNCWYQSVCSIDPFSLEALIIMRWSLLANIYHHFWSVAEGGIRQPQSIIVSIKLQLGDEMSSCAYQSFCSDEGFSLGDEMPDLKACRW